MADHKWLYSLLPITAISSGLSIIIPLAILDLNGTVVDVSIAFAIYSLVSIPASLFWGRITDQIGRLRSLILFSILATFPIILLMYLVTSIPVLEISYGIFAFIATAASPALNIMVMGLKRNPSVPKYFSEYSIYAMFGTMLAFLAGSAVNAADIKYYLGFLLVMNVFAAVFAGSLINKRYVKTLHKDKKNVKLTTLLFAPLNMLSHLPNLITGMGLARTIHENVNVTKVDGTKLLLISIALMNLSIYLFNTSYVPYLKEYGLSYGSIFAINLFNSLGQLAIYAFVLLILTRIDLHKYYGLSTFLRSVCYAVAIVPILIVTNVFYVNTLAYVIGGFAYALWNVTASVMLYDHIRGKKEGFYVGVWVAAIGASSVVGALASGLISSHYGYMWTFVVGIVVNAAALLTFLRARVSA